MQSSKVLLVEDEDTKSDEIENLLNVQLGDDVDIVRCRCLTEATTQILTKNFDVILLDLMLPRRIGEDAIDVSDELLDYLSETKKSKGATIVAITRYSGLLEEKRDRFLRQAIFLVQFEDDETWKQCLMVCLQKASFRTNLDFVILCALEEERTAFKSVVDDDLNYGELVQEANIDCRKITLGDKEGFLIVQPRMGLVDASIMATKCLELFEPKIICMSGICGGFSDEVSLGTLVIADPTWEHQAGKWKDEDFEPRGFQEPLQNSTRVKINQIIQSDPNLVTLLCPNDELKLPTVGVVLAPLVSGSAVIASEEHGVIIKSQHGKVSGVDMEVYGLHRAVALHGANTLCFAAKTVVDFADNEKDDSIHKEGAILSARFVVKVIKDLLI